MPLARQPLAAWNYQLVLLNSVLALFAVGVRLWSDHASAAAALAALWLPLLGLAAGGMAWRGRLPGLWGCALFYLPQTASYFSARYNISFKGGLSLAAVLPMPQGVLVLNLVAIALLLLASVVLWQRLRPWPAFQPSASSR